MRPLSRSIRPFAVALALITALASPAWPAARGAKTIGDTNKEFMSPSALAPFPAPAIGDTNKEFMSPSAQPAGGAADRNKGSAERTLMMATTTSVDATGLLDAVAGAFEASSGIALKWVAVGTGAALRQARDGNADVVIVHARKLEEEFLREGWGVNRRVIARNYFLLVGPPGDPAGVKGAASAAEAFGRIRAAGAPFASRGDNSGTHARELEIWALAGGKPEKGYLETGQGMAETLRVAAERRAYTLTDTATFAALRGLDGLVPVFESSPQLENIYAVIAVSPFRVPSARYGEAMAFIAFLTSPAGQKIIAGFKGRTDRPLFEPMAAVKGVDLLK